ncbi:MAG: kelch repeat-containing protein [Polyangia bacterium]|jgi:cysteine-rich repeat protein|nr:kelch repeat-containing protein [Polyangia bacterium]
MVFFCGCKPEIGFGGFSCDRQDPGGCPTGWVCLDVGAEQRCFPRYENLCGNGTIDPGERCDQQDFGGLACEDYGLGSGTLVCEIDCKVWCNRCGDGRLHQVPGPDGEECDDGNAKDGDGCSRSCKLELCGNGRVDFGEECDDGNVIPGDGCSPFCRMERCGNGLVEYASGEECDDGNARSHDGCSSGCTVEVPIWSKWLSTLENGRMGHSLVFDTVNQRFVLFGGGAGAGFLGDTWFYDRIQWFSPRPSQAPSPRSGHSMAYDTMRERVVLFGGYGSSGHMNDTWVFEGTTWRRLDPVVSPPEREAGELVYDSARQRLVLFGGANMGSLCLGDTWELNGDQWTQVSTAQAPSGMGHRMVYDNANHRVVLVGGHCDSVWRSDTWFYEDQEWRIASPSGSSPVTSSAGLAFDAARGRVVLQGGLRSGEISEDLWEFDGQTWTQPTVAGQSPGAIYGHRMEYDPARERVLLFGGFWMEGASWWEYDGAQWFYVPVPLEPPVRRGAAMACDSDRGRAVLFGGVGEAGLLDDTWEFDGLQWLSSAGDATPAARAGHAMTFDSEMGRVILYGGAEDDYGSGIMGDLWTYDAQGWQEETPAGDPGRRAGMGLTFHGQWGRTVMFGGAKAGTLSMSMPNDLWELHDLEWRLVLPGPSSLSGRVFAGLGYDSSRDALVLVGGAIPQNMATLLLTYDLWEFREDAWFEVGTDHASVGRGKAILFFNQARGLITQHGGEGPSGNLSDTREWDGTSWRLLAPALTPPPMQQPAGCYDARRRVLVMVGGTDHLETWEFAYQSAYPEEDCLDPLGEDEDGDGLVNCDDPDCNLVPECAPHEICLAGNTEDRDGDGLVGCADPNCGGAPCGPGGLRCISGRCCELGVYVEQDCGDGFDNDCDGRTDCEDPDCASATECQ